MRKKKQLFLESQEEFIKNSVLAILKVIQSSIDKMKISDHEKNILMTTVFLSVTVTMIKNKVEEENWSQAFLGISSIFKTESEKWKKNE